MKSEIKPTKASDITRSWHLVDVKGQVLGRVTTTIANLLMGKSKPYFAKNMDCGDYVVVINSASVAVTGKKEKEKLYGNYSGFPGGLKQKALWQVRKEKPDELIRHAVSGMIPHNKLHDLMMKRLYIFADATHPYQDKIKGA